MSDMRGKREVGLPAAFLKCFADSRLKFTFFCFHFPSAHLVYFCLGQLSPIYPRIPLDNLQRTGVNLLHPDGLCILYVWVEAAITIEIARARELNFSTQEKMSHTPTQNTASLVAHCRWRNWYLCIFFGLCLHV